MSDTPRIIKYPRTNHLEGSRFQAGDDDLETIPFAHIAGKNMVIEEKVDGANTAIRFAADGTLLLQSRGHFLSGGPREKQFSLFKKWAACHQNSLYDMLGSRYILYGEWLYAKHTIYYDLLPHYFLEFDIYDTQDEIFLSTDLRSVMTSSSNLCSVPVLKSGMIDCKKDLLGLVGASQFRSGSYQNLDSNGRKGGSSDSSTHGLSENFCCSDRMMEGIYIKIEENGQVVDRLKYVRGEFCNNVAVSENSWVKQPIIPNQLMLGVDIFAHV